MTLELSDRTRLRSVRLKLGQPVAIPGVRLEGKAANEKALHTLAELEKAKWRVEEATATARAPSGALVAVGGYIRDTDHRRRPSRLYGSRVHVVDLKSRQPVHVFECSPVEKKGRDERGTKRVLDITFVASWRCLAAITGNHLILWDTETGAELGRSPHAKSMKSGRVRLMRDDKGASLIVGSGKKASAYPIIRDR